MALKKTFMKDDLTTGEYVRLVGVSVANRQYNEADNNVPNTVLSFSVYKDESSVKDSSASAFMDLQYIVPVSSLGMDLSASWSDIAASVYSHKSSIDGLSDAEDLN